MQQLARLQSTIANILKKAHETSLAMIDNLKA